MKNIIRSGIIALICIATMVSTVVAATAAPADRGGSMLLTLFIGFFALIVVFQLVPACLLFVGIVKGLFSRKQGAEQETSNR